MQKMDGTVLVVDDEEGVRNILGQMLTTMGMSVSTASDGDFALEILKAEKFDYLITDISMPNMSGIELIRKAHEMGALANTKVVIVGGSFSKYTGKERYLLGRLAAGFIKKPFTQETVYKTIFGMSSEG